MFRYLVIFFIFQIQTYLAVDIIFMEEVSKVDKEKKFPTYQKIIDQNKINKLNDFLTNERAQLAISLYKLSQKLNVNINEVPYYIAIAKGGNYAKEGFNFIQNDKLVEMHSVPYIVLGFSLKGSK